MNYYDRICDFQNLYRAHTIARRGKRYTKEVIDFELNLSENLVSLSKSLRSKNYRISGYYNFMIFDPKERQIHALNYIDRVVQHCLCDEVLSEILDKKLIYDNSACRKNKGSHFAINRLSIFMRSFYQKYSNKGYFLKCDIRKYFENIDHRILKNKLKRIIFDIDVLDMLYYIIDSFHSDSGKGLPMGNQTSQWFAIFYLDGLDRLVKEKLHIKYYTRYMDDFILVHENKEYLDFCLTKMKEYLEKNLLLSFNNKTQIFPFKNGIDYLGFHFYLTPFGKVIRRVRKTTKNRFKKKLLYLEKAYRKNYIDLDEIKQVLISYKAHFNFGHTYLLRKSLLKNFKLLKTK